MYRSANASGILDKMKFIQNGVDEVRRNTTIKVDMHNNGGSFVKLPDSVATEDQNNQHLETFINRTILLSGGVDIYHLDM